MNVRFQLYLRDTPDELLQQPDMRPLAHALGRATDSADVYKQARLYNFLLAHHLTEILDAVASESIAVQPLKGALYVDMLYDGDLGARPMSDLDILVPKHDVERACRALEQLDYRFTGHSNENDKTYARGQVSVELHWALFHDLMFVPDADQFFVNTISASVQGRALQVGRPAVQMFYLLAHAATHALRWTNRWIVDAILLLRRYGPIDWSEVEDIAQRHSALAAIRIASRQLNWYFPGTYPERSPLGVRERAVSILAGPGSANIPYGPGLRSLAVRLLLTENVRAAAQMLWGKIKGRISSAGPP